MLDVFFYYPYYIIVVNNTLVESGSILQLMTSYTLTNAALFQGIKQYLLSDLDEKLAHH